MNIEIMQISQTNDTVHLIHTLCPSVNCVKKANTVGTGIYMHTTDTWDCNVGKQSHAASSPCKKQPNHALYLHMLKHSDTSFMSRHAYFDHISSFICTASSWSDNLNLSSFVLENYPCVLQGQVIS